MKKSLLSHRLLSTRSVWRKICNFVIPTGCGQNASLGYVTMTDNLLIILILLVLGYAAVTGFMKGLLAQVGQIVGLVIGVLAARALAPGLLGYLAVDSGGSASAVTTVLCYVLIFLVAYFAVVLIARLIRLVVKVVCLGILDRIGGAVFKIVKWALIISLAYNLCVVIELASVPDRQTKPFENFICRLAPAVFAMQDSQNK